MSKLLTIILIISSLFVIGLSIVAVLLHQNSTGFRISLPTTPTPTLTTLYSLTFSPQKQIVRLGEINTVDISLEAQDNGDNAPRLVQMEIAYDPQAFFEVNIAPGDFFGNPIETLKIINTNTGRLSYALSSDTTTTNPVIARLYFVPNPVFSGSETTISFLGKTTVKGTTDNPSITTTHGVKLFFASESAVPQR